MRECNAKVMPQKITLTLRPEAAFEMPYSEGYQLYSALLGVMGEADSAMARHTNDSAEMRTCLKHLSRQRRALLVRMNVPRSECASANFMPRLECGGHGP